MSQKCILFSAKTFLPYGSQTFEGNNEVEVLQQEINFIISYNVLAPVMGGHMIYILVMQIMNNSKLRSYQYGIVYSWNGGE